MKIDPNAASRLMALRNLVERQEITLVYDDAYLRSLVPVALHYKRYEALEVVFDRIGLPAHLDLKERITLWQLLESKDDG